MDRTERDGTDRDGTGGDRSTTGERLGELLSEARSLSAGVSPKGEGTGGPFDARSPRRGGRHGHSPEEVPDDVSDRVQPFLHHGHLPELAGYGVVEVDRDTDTVSLPT